MKKILISVSPSSGGDYIKAIEFSLINNFMNKGKPIMGICRGFQVMNIALGGTIIQDMTEPSREYHTSKDLTFKIHSTYCDEKSFLTELYDKEFKVNSHHHQCIKDIANNLVAIQYALEDGCIEGMIHTTYPYIGVQ